MPRPPRKIAHSRVPAGRAERLAHLGLLASRLAVGAAAEGVRRLGGAASPGHVLLSGANAKRLASSLSSMRGAAMKLGQLLSLEADDLLPPEVADALAVLRDAADAMPPKQLRRVLVDAYERDWEERFRHFDFDPIAAASIGQVHAATTTDGRDLALKVQFPGVARSIESDVDNLAAALRVTQLLPRELDFDPLVAEAKRQLKEEANYQTEATHLRRYAELLQDEPDVVVPGVHDDLTTDTILAMDRLHGLPLEDLCGADHSDERRDEVASLLLRLALRELFEFRFIQSDPHFGNFLLLEDGRVGLIDLGAGYDVPERFHSGYARLLQASLEEDRRGMRKIATEIGFLDPEEPDAIAEALVGLIEMATEPFRHDGVYDFGNSDLTLRARDDSMAIFMEHGFLAPPPPETLFLQRKLGGTFLLCMRLGARIDARRLLEDALARSGAATR